MWGTCVFNGFATVNHSSYMCCKVLHINITRNLGIFMGICKFKIFWYRGRANLLRFSISTISCTKGWRIFLKMAMLINHLCQQVALAYSIQPVMHPIRLSGSELLFTFLQCQVQFCCFKSNVFVSGKTVTKCFIVTFLQSEFSISYFPRNSRTKHWLSLTLSDTGLPDSRLYSLAFSKTVSKDSMKLFCIVSIMFSTILSDLIIFDAQNRNSSPSVHQQILFERLYPVPIYTQQLFRF